MTVISFGNAIKAARRGIYQYPNAWKVAVLCGGAKQAQFAFDEARLMLEAGSLAVESANFASRVITTDRGGRFEFHVVADEADCDHIRGKEFPHIIWLFDPDPRVREIVQTRYRSHVVPDEALRSDEATL